MSIMDYSAAIINHALEDHLIKYENVLIVLLSESDSKTNMYRMKEDKLWPEIWVRGFSFSHETLMLKSISAYEIHPSLLTFT